MKIRLTVMIGLLVFTGLVGAAPWGAAAQGGAPTGAGPLVTQDFQDVPTAATFYTYVHNLFVDGAVSGYTCGGPGEPCVPPANLPYFRPDANVTRGQNAKFTDNGRRVLSGAHSGGAGGPYYGLFSALNADTSNSYNAGLYGKGATGVWGASVSTGTAYGYGGFFRNFGGGTGSQYGAYSTTAGGVGLAGVSEGSTSSQGSTGVLGISELDGGVGGVFTATNGAGSIGLAAVGHTGAVLSGGGAASTGLVAVGHTGAVLAGGGVAISAVGDGLEVAGAGGPSDAVYALLPNGDTNYSFYGFAHIHGTNVASADYESEVVYDGAAPLALGSVVALDPANAMGGALGVLPADTETAGAAIGVLSYRLTTVTVNTIAKTVIDAQATLVQPGDRAYITILGRVTMPLPPGATVGTRLAVGAAGAPVLTDATGLSFGRVASRPDATGRGYVLVNFK